MRRLLCLLFMRRVTHEKRYSVRRQKFGVNGDGTLILSTDSYREAKRRAQSMRIAHGDRVTITTNALWFERVQPTGEINDASKK